MYNAGLMLVSFVNTTTGLILGVHPSNERLHNILALSPLTRCLLGNENILNV